MKIQLTFNDCESETRLRRVLEKVCIAELSLHNIDQVQVAFEPSDDPRNSDIVCRVSLVLPRGIIACSAKSESDESAMQVAVKRAARLLKRNCGAPHLLPVPEIQPINRQAKKLM